MTEAVNMRRSAPNSGENYEIERSQPAPLRHQGTLAGCDDLLVDRLGQPEERNSKRQQMRIKGCVAIFKNQQESDWLGRPGSVSCGHLEQLVDELNLLPNIRTAHPPRLTLPDHVNCLVSSVRPRLSGVARMMAKEILDVFHCHPQIQADSSNLRALSPAQGSLSVQGRRPAPHTLLRVLPVCRRPSSGPAHGRGPVNPFTPFPFHP